MTRPERDALISRTQISRKSLALVAVGALILLSGVAYFGVQLVLSQRVSERFATLEHDAISAASSIEHDLEHFDHNASSFAVLPASFADAVRANKEAGVGVDSPPGWFGNDREAIIACGFLDEGGDTIVAWGDEARLPSAEETVVVTARSNKAIARTAFDLVDGAPQPVTWVVPLKGSRSIGGSTEAASGALYSFVVNLEEALDEELTQAAESSGANVELVDANEVDRDPQEAQVLQVTQPIVGTSWALRMSLDRETLPADFLPFLWYVVVAVLATTAFVVLAYALILRTRAQRDTERFALELLTQQVQAEERFLASMSHEMRTPLNSIIGFSNVLANGMVGPVNDEQRRQLSMVERSGRRLLGLVNDVLDLAKVRSGQEVPEFEPIDVRTLVDRAVEVVQISAHESGLTLTSEVPAHLPALVSDRQMIERILLNLLGNAVKFTQEGSVTLRVSTQGSAMRFDVTDTGPGIPAEEIHRVSKEFFQVARSADSAKPQGMGLGLTISGRLARLLGGTIDLESEIGVGSTFSLVLPIRPSDTPIGSSGIM